MITYGKHFIPAVAKVLSWERARDRNSVETSFFLQNGGTRGSENRVLLPPTCSLFSCEGNRSDALNPS